jgi:predicted ATPase
VTVPRQDQELLERHAELALVEAGIAAAAAGHGGLLWIEGRAGIGKTELVRRARHAAAGAGLRVCGARGAELEREFPFGVVRQLFEGVLQGAEPADQTALLSGAAGAATGALGLSSDVAVPNVLPVLHGLYWLTVNLATTRPLLIAVDDAHWADAVSLRYLDYLARRLDELQVLVLVASRPAEPHSDPDLLARIGTETWRGTNPAGELRKVIGFTKPIESFTPAPAIDQIIPFRD